MAVESVCVIPGATEDEVYLSVLRSINGVNVRFIERMASRAPATQADSFFVDCGLAYDGVPEDAFTGLDHLNGETVSILGDGAVFPDQVVANGTITLDSEVSKAAIGLPYRYTVKPMRIDINSVGGTSKGSLKAIPELTISFLETSGAQYGQDVDHLYDIDWRTTEPYGSPPSLFTGDKTVTTEGGFDTETPIMISGIQPLPCTVRAIVAKVQVVNR
jgi:hypothetical protein